MSLLKKIGKNYLTIKMTNKENIKYYIDWLSIKFASFIYFTISVLEKYDHVIDTLTKNVGRIGVLIGVATVLVRFWRTWKNKGVNGD